MSTLLLYSKIEGLPEHLQKQVLDFIEFLLSREIKDQRAKEQVQPTAGKKPLKAGFLKGSFVMAADFDEPLEDFNEYMQ